MAARPARGLCFSRVTHSTARVPGYGAAQPPVPRAALAQLQGGQNMEPMLGAVVTAKACPRVPALPWQPEVQPPGVAALSVVHWVLLDP